MHVYVVATAVFSVRRRPPASSLGHVNGKFHHWKFGADSPMNTEEVHATLDIGGPNLMHGSKPKRSVIISAEQEGPVADAQRGNVQLRC